MGRESDQVLSVLVKPSRSLSVGCLPVGERTQADGVAPGCKIPVRKWIHQHSKNRGRLRNSHLYKMKRSFSLWGFIQEYIVLCGDREECSSAMSSSARPRSALVPQGI